MSTISPTYFTLATPNAPGAIGTIVLSGPNAMSILGQLFQPASNPYEFEVNGIVLGTIGEKSAGGDQVVVAKTTDSPHPTFEIHSHGGREVVAWIKEALAAHGAVSKPLNHHLQTTGASRISAAAIEQLHKTATQRTAAILLDQCNGALDRAIESAIPMIANGQLRQAETLLGDLMTWSELGSHLVNPWKVVVAGAPNTGKSSLINCLAGYERCIVSQTEGTTRDVVAVRIAVSGWPMEIMDSAGWRDGQEPLEQRGIEVAKSVAAEADLCLWVVGTDRDPIWPTCKFHRRIDVVNKIDLDAVWKVESKMHAVQVSATKRKGIDNLLAEMEKMLIWSVPEPQQAIPFAPWIKDGLKSALVNLCIGKNEAAMEDLNELLG